MIVTLTANPSLDRTAALGSPLQRGALHRLGEVTIEPGGKGVNVARCIQLAGEPVLAVLPAAPRDQMLTLLEMRGIPFSAVDVAPAVRTNLTLTEPDGTTTKLNEPGGELSAQECNALRGALLVAAQRASWVVLSGSLPPGAPVDFYVDLVRALRPMKVKIAVDTSDAPLQAIERSLPASAPDLLKPNSDELAQLTGADAIELEERAAAGDLAPVLEAGRRLVNRGVGSVLATLGAAGAVLVTEDGAWSATPPSITPRSTVGAGDSSVAGFVLAQAAGGAPADCLRRAVAYGAGATALAGTAVPAPEQTDPDGVVITQIA